MRVIIGLPIFLVCIYAIREAGMICAGQAAKTAVLRELANGKTPPVIEGESTMTNMVLPMIPYRFQTVCEVCGS